MSRFALRIFLSAWLILLATVGLTFLASSWLPNLEDAADGRRYEQQMLEVVAQEVRPRLADGRAAVAETFGDMPVLEFDRLVQVYLLDADRRDVLDRSLPRAIARHARAGRLAEWDQRLLSDLRIGVYGGDLEGYTLVSYHGRFPFGRVIVRPGARVLLFVIALLVSAVVSVVLARFVVLPVRRLRVAGQQVAEGDLSVRVAPTVGSRRDDIAELARDFDVMTERVQSLLESQQRTMRDVSHELRSPLARLQALVSIARQKLEGFEGAPDDLPLDRMERELEHLDELIGEILSYARLEAKEDITRHRTDLVDLVQNIVDDASVEGQDHGKQIQLQSPATCMLDVDAGLIQSAVENVVRNALKHTAPGSTVGVTIAERAESIAIVIRDRGPGVPEEALDKMFESFFRVEDGRSTRTGSGGVGLAIAERSIQLHGGTIRAFNCPDGGLRIEIVLPR